MWRFALWAKLSVTHKCTDDIRSPRALYDRMDAQIAEDDFKSDIIELCQGVPQGGPTSGKLFALFNSDVPACYETWERGPLSERSISRAPFSWMIP